MTTDHHTALSSSDAISISIINDRFADLDEAIGTNVAGITSVSVAMLYDSKATTTDGGSATATTWHTRTLNQEIDADSIVTLDTNQFTPVSGTYLIMAAAPCYRINENRLRLYNQTQTSTTYLALNAANYSASALVGYASLYTTFTANGTDAYTIDHYAVQAKATNGLGLASDDGAAEVFTMVLLFKLG